VHFPASPSPRSAPLRILAIDDELRLTRMVACILAPHGHTVATADSGEQALGALAVETFDVVVCDLSLGAGMSGLGVADAVRARWPETGFVLATGWGAGSAGGGGTGAVAARRGWRRLPTACQGMSSTKSRREPSRTGRRTPVRQSYRPRRQWKPPVGKSAGNSMTRSSRTMSPTAQLVGG